MTKISILTVALAFCLFTQAVKGQSPHQTGEVRCLKGHSSLVLNVAFSRDGKSVFSASHDNTVRLWDVGSGKQLKEFRGHTKGVNFLALNPDGSRFLSGSVDATVRLWDVGTEKDILSLTGSHKHEIWGVAISADEKYALSSGGDPKVVLWDLKQKQAVREFEHPGTVWCVAISPKEEVFATGCGNTIRFFRYSDNKPFRQLEGHTRDVRTVVFFPDGEHLASGSYDGTIRIWKWREGKETKRLVGHKGMVGCLAVSLDGKSILSCGREDSSVRLWAVDTGDELQRFDGHQGNVEAVALSPDGKLGASGGWDGTIRIWKLAIGDERKKLEQTAAGERAKKETQEKAELNKQGLWDHLDLTNAKDMGDFVRINKGKELLTKKAYAGPVEVTVVARTDKDNLRLLAFNGAKVTFGSPLNPGDLRINRPDDDPKTKATVPLNKVPLKPNTWYTLRWTITEEGMAVAVDNKVVFSEKREHGRWYDLSDACPIRVSGATKAAIIDVKSLVVVPLAAMKPTPKQITQKKKKDLEKQVQESIAKAQKQDADRIAREAKERREAEEERRAAMAKKEAAERAERERREQLTKVAKEDRMAVLSVNGRTTETDPKDKVTGRPCKVYSVKMTEGKTYRIEMNRGNDWGSPYCRLEDSAGKKLAEDTKGEGVGWASISFEAPKDDTYQLIAVMSGPFTLTVKRAYDDKQETDLLAKRKLARREAEALAIVRFKELAEKFGFDMLDYTKGPKGQPLQTKDSNEETTTITSIPGSGKVKMAVTCNGYLDEDKVFVKHGPCTFWFDKPGENKERIKHAETYYFEGKAHGVHRAWHWNGKLWYQVALVNGKLQGLLRGWDNDGSVWFEKEFKDDLAHGKYTQWHPNGQKELEGQFLKSWRQGAWKSWYANGQMHDECTYKDDSLNGFSRKFYEDGGKCDEVNYKQGLLDGPYVEYFPRLAGGGVRLRANYASGSLHGICTHYHSDGRVGITIRYQFGNPGPP